MPRRLRAKSCKRALVVLTQSEGFPYAVAVTLALRFARGLDIPSAFSLRSLACVKKRRANPITT